MRFFKTIITNGEKLLNEKSTFRRLMKATGEMDIAIKAVKNIGDGDIGEAIGRAIEHKGFLSKVTFTDSERMFDIVMGWIDKQRKVYPSIENLYDQKDAIVAQCTWNSTQKIGLGTISIRLDKYTFMKIKSYEFEKDERWGKEKHRAIRFTFNGVNAKLFYKEFMRGISDEYKRLYNKLYIYSSSGNTIITDKHKPESMVQPEFWLIKGFIDKLISEESKVIFDKMDQVFKSSFLLYGEPGTGKTRSIITLASLYNARVVRINLNDSNWKNELEDIDFFYSHYSIMTFVIIEDIDMYIPNTNRDDEVEKKSSEKVKNGVNEKGLKVNLNSTKNNADKTSLLGDLFQYMDGTDSQSGALYFLTTNHIEKLDKGLLRCGRLDYKVEFLYLDREHQDMLIENCGLTREELNDDTIPEFASPATLTVYLRSRALGIDNWTYADYEKAIKDPSNE